MSRSPANKPTETELEILQVLWNHGPSTVRGVHNVLSTSRPVGYTTVLKMMQIMADKGLLLRRDGETRAHIYQPASSEDATRSQMVSDLMERVFQGSAESLILHALSGNRTTSEERDRIRRAIEAAEKEQA